jgi:hypothetical protein
MRLHEVLLLLGAIAMFGCAYVVYRDPTWFWQGCAVGGVVLMVWLASGIADALEKGKKP